MRNIIYTKSFKNLLQSTNEKEVVRNVINKIIKNRDIETILEIGGGNGEMIRGFADAGKKITVVEPNENFSGDLKRLGLLHIKSTWEKFLPRVKYDLILAPWVIGHFNKEDMAHLVDKMYTTLNEGGSLIIICIDDKKGDWRKIHNYFYTLIGIRQTPSTTYLKLTLKDYSFKSKKIITRIIAKNSNEMVNILGIDFAKYKTRFSENRHNLMKELEKYTDANNKISLSVVHQMYILNK